MEGNVMRGSKGTRKLKLGGVNMIEIHFIH